MRWMQLIGVCTSRLVSLRRRVVSPRTGSLTGRRLKVVIAREFCYSGFGMVMAHVVCSERKAHNG
jgi:hypothetical protein